MKRSIIILVTIMVVGLLGFWIRKHNAPAQAGAGAGMPVITVAAAQAQNETWPNTVSTVANLRAEHGVDVSSEVAGMVAQITFQSGQLVSEGQSLIQLNDSVEHAELQNNQAELRLAQLSYNREKNLFKKASSAKATLDTAEAKLTEAQSRVEKTTALIAQKNIRAPFSGIIGISYLTTGSYVNPGQALVTLQSIDNLYVDFTLPEQYVQQLQLNQVVKVKPLIANSKIREGMITAINAKVSEQTHNIQVQARISNPEHQLLPGFAAEVTVVLPGQAPVVAVPSTAIDYNLHGDSVFVIQKAKQGTGLTVKRRYVKVGRTRDTQVAIVSGLKANEQVVTVGQLKLRDNTPVKIDASQGL